MKKARISVLIILVGTLIVGLSSCATLDNYISNSINASLDNTVKESDAYKQYVDYKENGLLDETGMAIIPEIQENDPAKDNEGKCLISLANNEYLTCEYRTDSNKVYTDSVYLEMGESLYIDSVSVENRNSNLYEFSMFRIWEYDQNGIRGSKPYATVKTQNGLILTVPKDFSGSGFAIEPVGEYTNRHIEVSAYYLNDVKAKQILDAGTWRVNDKQFKGSTDISPVDPYRLEYDYSNYKNDYYFVGSNPECWFSKDDEYSVIFKEASSTDMSTDYSVQLHPYITMNVNNKCIGLIDKIPLIGTNGKGIINSIRKNSEDITPSQLGVESFSIRNLRAGDSITVRVGSDYKISGNGVHVNQPVPLGSDAENGYEYTIIVPDTNSKISIDITKRNSDSAATYQGYDLENAILILERANGTEIEKGDEIPAENEEVVVRIKPYEGYYISGKNVKNDEYSKSMKYSAFAKDAEAIIAEHPAIHYVFITLKKADEYGTCSFKLDGQIIDGSTVYAKVGQSLEIEYTVKDGYKIVRSNWISDKWSSLINKKSIKEKISIDSSMNYTSISREAYGIEVER